MEGEEKTILEVIGGFFLVFALLFGLWLFTGGPQRASSDKGIFLEPPAPESSGQIYGGTPIQYRSLATTTVKVPVLGQ